MYVNMNIRENFSIIGELGDILFWFKCLFIINYWLQLVVSCFYLNTTFSELLRNEWMLLMQDDVGSLKRIVMPEKLVN